MIPIEFEFDTYSLITRPLNKGIWKGMECDIEKGNWYESFWKIGLMGLYFFFEPPLTAYPIFQFGLRINPASVCFNQVNQLFNALRFRDFFDFFFATIKGDITCLLAYIAIVCICHFPRTVDNATHDSDI